MVIARTLRTTATAVALTMVATVLVLVAGLATASPGGAVAHSENAKYGHTASKNGVLNHGCKNYRYTYEIHPPEGQWALEVFISGPGGQNLFSDGVLQGFQGKQGTRRFRICRTATRPGTFRIKALLSTTDGNDTFEAWLPVTKFKLRARR